MKIIKVTKEYFRTEDEKVYFFEPLDKEISVEDMQKIVNANEKLIKELKEFIDRIVAKATEFWGYVERDEMPPEEVDQIEVPELVSTFETVEPDSAILEYREAKQELDLVKSRVDEIKETIAERIGDREKIEGFNPKPFIKVGKASRSMRIVLKKLGDSQ
jgi:hypothetical protein